MTIEQTANAVTATGTGVEIYRLLSQKMQLKLEAVGLKSSGGALRPRLAKGLGLRPRDSHEKFIAKIDEKLLELKGRM